MKNKSLALAVVVVALFLSYALATVQALNPGIYVDPGTITVPGGSTTITLVTPKRATGTLTVKCIASGKSWTTAVDTGTSHQEIWKFPDDFPTADTYTNGMYDVTADITMNVGRFKWVTSFEVQFFVVPDLPLGTLMAVVACFGAVMGYKKLKK